MENRVVDWHVSFRLIDHDLLFVRIAFAAGID
jgi:hypothetical protein